LTFLNTYEADFIPSNKKRHASQSHQVEEDLCFFGYNFLNSIAPRLGKKKKKGGTMDNYLIAFIIGGIMYATLGVQTLKQLQGK